MESCFKEQGSLIANKHEKEMYENSKKKLDDMQNRLEEMTQKRDIAEEQMSKSNGYSL